MAIILTTINWSIIPNKRVTYFISCRISRALCIDINEDWPAGITIIGVLDILCLACWEAVSLAYIINNKILTIIIFNYFKYTIYNYIWTGFKVNFDLKWT